MPEQLEDLFSTLADDVAARTTAPGARDAIATTRRRTAVMTAALATAAVVGVASFAFLGRDSSGSEPDPAPSPSPSLGIEVGNVPVWYDDAGLHRGDAVEQTAIALDRDNDDMLLTLVRTGALYWTKQAGEVWLHPWGARPRLVGTSQSGPAGDPESDIAVWFEGDELVLYDTSTGREIDRTTAPEVQARHTMEHVFSGNGILHVSPEEVVWLTKGGDHMAARLDLDTMEITEFAAARPDEGEFLIDVHGEVEVWSATAAEGIEFVIGDDMTLSPVLEPMARISPDGRFLLSAAAAPHGSSVLDLERAYRPDA